MEDDVVGLLGFRSGALFFTLSFLPFLILRVQEKFVFLEDLIISGPLAIVPSRKWQLHTYESGCGLELRLG